MFNKSIIVLALAAITISSLTTAAFAGNGHRFGGWKKPPSQQGILLHQGHDPALFHQKLLQIQKALQAHPQENLVEKIQGLPDPQLLGRKFINGFRLYLSSLEQDHKILSLVSDPFHIAGGVVCVWGTALTQWKDRIG